MKLLTLNQVAEKLNVDKTTLRLWDRNGKLPALRTQGGHRRYKKSDIFIMMGEELSLSDNDNVVAVYC